MAQKPNVVIIESDENKRYLYDIALEFQRVKVDTASTIKEGLELIVTTKPELIIVDEVVTDFHNFNLIEELEKKVPDNIPQIIVTNLRDVNTRTIEQHKIQKAFTYLADGQNTVGNVIRSSREAMDL